MLQYCLHVLFPARKSHFPGLPWPPPRADSGSASAKCWCASAAAKPDPDFSIHPIGKRVWDFFWEVMCQAKVIRERPLPGLAHAFVFWGFCVFALITLNHFATGAGLPVSRQHVRRRLQYVRALRSACWSRSPSLGLFVRRFVVRPQWLGELSKESGIIALLIFALMVTFIAGRASFRNTRKPLWWAHTLALLVFLPLIPHTKHLHLVLSPVTIFLSRGGFSDIPPLVGDEDFGLDTGKDLTKIVALQAYSCVECGRCTEHCPAFNTDKILDPKKIALGVRGYLNEFGPQSEEPLLGTHHFAGSGVPVHHLRRVRISMPGGNRASAHHHRPAPRRREHRQVGRRLRHQAVSRAGAQRQRARLQLQRARQIHPEAAVSRSSTARRNTACGSAAWAPTIRRAARSSRPSRA